MVEMKMFLEGFDDLERLYETRRRMNEARYKIKRVLVDTSLGCLDDKSIITMEEKARFLKLADALDSASDLLSDKINKVRKDCITKNVVGFKEDDKETKNEIEEDSEFF